MPTEHLSTKAPHNNSKLVSSRSIFGNKKEKNYQYLANKKEKNDQYLANKKGEKLPIL